MFHFGQIGEESSQEVWFGRLIDGLPLMWGCQEQDTLEGAGEGRRAWCGGGGGGDGGLWPLSWQERRQRRAKFPLLHAPLLLQLIVSQLLLGYTGPP